MSWLYRTFLRPTLFARDSETIHQWTVQTLGRVSRHPLLCEALASFFDAPSLPINLRGLAFPNPIGLAAGMDKEAEALPAWAALGFGFCELGAITWLPQPGNPKPRIFRAITAEGLVNRMGFNNPGAEAVAARLSEWQRKGAWPKHPVGLNLGKSKVTPLAEAARDYANSLEVLWPYADFFVLNVSSPNTPNLRQLQEKSALDEILAAVQESNRRLAIRAKPAPETGAPEAKESHPPSTSRQAEATREARPILVKVAPELSFDALDDILDLVAARDIAGVVATNTSTDRPETPDPALRRIYAESGGLSGRPLRARSTEVVAHLYRQTEGTLPVIGVGGVFDADDAWEKITAGASLVQVYTGLVYEGPSLARSIVTGLRERLQSAGLTDLTQAVGLIWNGR